METPPAGRGRTPLVLAVVAVLAILLAGYFAWLTIFRPAAKADPVRTTSVTNRDGGYTLRVPIGMSVKQQGKTTTLTDAGTLSITVTTTRRVAPRAANDSVIRAIRSRYASLTLLGTKKRTVDDQPALTSYGAVVDEQGRRTQFVLLAVRGPRTGLALSAFAPIGKDSSDRIQKRFDAVADSLRFG